MIHEDEDGWKVIVSRLARGFDKMKYKHFDNNYSSDSSGWLLGFLLDPERY